jgi:hypothetical protein
MKLNKVYPSASVSCIECGAELAPGSLFRWTPNPGNSRHGKGVCLIQAPNGTHGCGWNDLSDTDREIAASRYAGSYSAPPQAIETAQPAAHPATNGNNGSAGNGSGLDLLGMIAGAVTPIVASQVTEQVSKALQGRDFLNEDRVLELVEQALDSCRPTTRIEIRESGKPTKVIEGAHEALPKTLRYLSIGLSVYWHGPAGGGKTHAAEQVADALSARFCPIQCGKLSSESVLKGLVTVSGQAAETAFADALAESHDSPVLLFLDELDRWPSHLAVLLNSLLANGYIATRHAGRVDRGKHLYILAAGNTNMRGRNDFFPEAVAQEFSTIDRFTFVAFNYDEALEERIALSLNPHALPWVNWVRSIRPEALSGKYGKILATPRASFDGAKALAIGIPAADLASDLVFKGADEITRRHFLAAHPLPTKNMEVF